MIVTKVGHILQAHTERRLALGPGPDVQPGNKERSQKLEALQIET